LNLKDLITLIS